MASGDRSSYKVVLLGEGCVGKTSLVLRFCQDIFNESHKTTLQASFLTKRMTVGGTRVELAIWDTAGQERFRALGPIYYRDSQGAVLVYDVMDVDSFDRVKNWVKELRQMLGTNVVLAIVGNKIDLAEKSSRAVSEETAIKFAQTVGAVHYNTSAKLKRGVEEMFLDLSKRMLAATTSGGGAPRRQTTTLNITDDKPATSEGSGNCC